MKTKIKNLALIVLALLCGFFMYRASTQSFKYKEQVDLTTSLGDEVSTWKDKDSISHAKLRTIETSKAKDFIALQFKDSTINALQDVVKKHKKALRNKGSATIIKTQTTYDTIYRTDTINTDKDNRVGFINNDYITSTFGFSKDSTYYTLRTRDVLSIVIAEDKQGWFKKPIPFAEVTSESPYTEIKTFRTYQVTDERKRKWGVGPIAAYGVFLNGVPQVGGFIGFGVQYTWIEF